jgi:hypothetical protein
MTHLLEVLEHCNRKYQLSINHDPMQETACLRWDVELRIENNDGLAKKYRSRRATLDGSCRGMASMVVAEIFGSEGINNK